MCIEWSLTFPGCFHRVTSREVCQAELAERRRVAKNTYCCGLFRPTPCRVCRPTPRSEIVNRPCQTCKREAKHQKKANSNRRARVPPHIKRDALYTNKALPPLPLEAGRKTPPKNKPAVKRAASYPISPQARGRQVVFPIYVTAMHYDNEPIPDDEFLYMVTNDNESL